MLIFKFLEGLNLSNIQNQEIHVSWCTLLINKNTWRC